jgi:hypothetical protein
MATSKEKIDAIYDLRRAAEAKALAEKAVSERPSSAARDELLNMQIALEAKTMTAIEVCHECGHGHGPSEGHGPSSGSVLPFDSDQRFS